MPLVLVEGLVRDLVERLPVHAALPRRQSDADLHAFRGPRAEVHGLDRIPKAAGHLAGAAQVGLGHRDSELITAQATAHVGGPDDPQQLLSDQA